MPVSFTTGSDKFKSKLDSLLFSLDNAKSTPLTSYSSNNAMIERHGFYTLKDQYDDDAAVK